MKKRGRIALAVSLAAIAGVVLWQASGPRAREPVYQGKGLRVWLSENYYARPALNGPGLEAARSGLRQIGTNAIPTLLDLLRKKDSALVAALSHLWERHIIFSHYPLPSWLRFPSWYRTRATVLNDQALKGFEVLGADARQAAPALIEIYDRNSSSWSGFYASRALIAIGSDAARTAIPYFVRLLNDPDAQVRSTAAQALRRIDHDAAVKAGVK